MGGKITIKVRRRTERVMLKHTIQKFSRMPLMSRNGHRLLLQFNLQVVTYRSSGGFLSIGEEGYRIGVGGSNAYPQSKTSFWSLSGDPSDADLWEALTLLLTYVNIGEQEVALIFDFPYDSCSSLALSPAFPRTSMCLL